MATNLYEPCINPISGETFRTISYNEETYTMQWTLQPKGYVPFEHIHYNQDEIFYIKKGEMRILISGVEHIVKEGESITVAKGLAHKAFNNKEEVLDAIVEYKPGLDHYRFMECLCGLTNDNYLDNKGGINIPRMGYFLKRMNAKCMSRPTELPAPMFKIALTFFYLRGMLSGWSSLYSKYTS